MIVDRDRLLEYCNYIITDDIVKYDDEYDDLPNINCHFDNMIKPWDNEKYILGLELDKDKFCCYYHYNFCENVAKTYPLIWRSLFLNAFHRERVFLLLGDQIAKSYNTTYTDNKICELCLQAYYSNYTDCDKIFKKLVERINLIIKECHTT